MAFAGASGGCEVGRPVAFEMVTIGDFDDKGLWGSVWVSDFSFLCGILGMFVASSLPPFPIVIVVFIGAWE